MNDFLKILIDNGFPIASAIAGGYFIFLTLKFILAGVMSSIHDLSIKIVSLDNRVKVMDNEIVKTDLIVSEALGLRMDTSRVARGNPRVDGRKD